LNKFITDFNKTVSKFFPKIGFFVCIIGEYYNLLVQNNFELTFIWGFLAFIMIEMDKKGVLHEG